LSNAIGFRYGYLDPRTAASDFIGRLKGLFLPAGNEERIVSVILDGENAWGSYQQAGRPFFEALYGMVGSEPEICTVTFSEFLEGNPVRGVKPHFLGEQERVCKLAHASWIDEYGSRPGNDLGTWIGEREENAAWDLLRETRELFKREKITTPTRPEAYEALYAAEGSDWFWWYGDDQTCEAEPDFDDLFRHHLRCAYMLAALEPPPELEYSIVPHVVTWSFLDQKNSISSRDRLRFKAGCPGLLTWSVNDWKDVCETVLNASGGVMAGLNSYTASLGPFDEAVRSVEFLFKCRCKPVCDCAPEDLCCDGRRYTVLIERTMRTADGRSKNP